MKKLVALCAILAGVLLGQEGHPLTGTWHGEFKPASGAASRLVLVMHWDGKAVTGQLNPGPNSSNLSNVTFSGWQVHIEGDTKDKKHVVGDGKMDNVGSYHRTVSGTWTQGDAKGTFKITRD